MFGNLFNQKKQPLQPEESSQVSVPVSNQPISNTNQQAAVTPQGVASQADTKTTSPVASRINPNLKQNLSALSHLDQRSTQVLQHAQEETKRIRPVSYTHLYV